MCLFLTQVSINFKNIKVWIKIFHSSTPLEQNQDSSWEWINMHPLDVWCCGAAFNTNWTPLSWESSHVLCTGIAKDDLITYTVWHQNKHLIVWNNFQSLVTQHPFKPDLTHLLMKKVRVNLINLESVAAIYTEGQVNCQGSMLGHLICSVW